MKLDYTITDVEQRKKIVDQALTENPNPSPKYLDILADYLVMCMGKEEKKEKYIITPNQATTVNKRETSFEGLATQFENGEDGVYNLISKDKYVLFRPKVSITQEDLQEIPELAQPREAIDA